MKLLHQFGLAAVLLLSSAGFAAADRNSKQRVSEFAQLPDWSGLWEQFDIGANGSPADAQENRAFHDAMKQHPPYNAAWEAQHPRDQRQIGRQDKPTCTHGFPAIMIGSPQMFEALVSPQETTLIFSLRNEIRHIYTDGQGHVPEDERVETQMGDSIGHWDGQTLIVETIATTSPANLAGEPLSENAKYGERIRMVDKNTLEDKITIVDPTALMHPWELTRLYHRVPNMRRLLEEDCEGNDRNPVVNGKFEGIAPPKD